MPKDDAPKKKAGSSKSKDAASKASTKEEGDGAGSEPVELEAVKDKKGEPDDNLRRRAEWFQKRTGG